MRNLLRDAISREDIQSILDAGPGTGVLPARTSPRWRASPRLGNVATAIVDRAREEAEEALSELTDELYAVFHQTGERQSFERVYFERRRRLGRAAMAVLLAGDRERFQGSLVAKMTGTMAEFSWALPAHVSAPSGKDPAVIDLFSAETANTMAELAVVFADCLPDELIRQVKERLRQQFFENYLNRHADFAWVDAGMNWNAVCHQGVLGAALTLEEDTVLLAKMLELARGYLPCFLNGFGADGSTSEGPGYWQYGFGRFAELNAQLEARTDGALSLFAFDPQVEAIARFAPACVLSGGHFVNFSDGPRVGNLDPALLFYLAGRLPESGAREETGIALRAMAEQGLDLQAVRCDFFHLARVFTRCPAETGDTGAARPDVYFPEWGVVVARGEDGAGNRWEFAAKAGHNAEHHNHNDCGSFLVNVNAVPVLVEIGAPEYTADYFGPGRYEHLAARSSGHSVPLVNGCEQNAGREFEARILECTMDDRHVVFRLDLTRCYPEVAAARSVVRSFVFDKDAGTIRMEDRCEFDGEGTFESVLMTESEVVAGKDVLLLSGTVEVRFPEGTSLGGVDRLFYPQHNSGAPREVNRIRFVPAGLSKVVSLLIRAVPCQGID